MRRLDATAQMNANGGDIPWKLIGNMLKLSFKTGCYVVRSLFCGD